MRCCPPDVELYADNHPDMLENHLQICPWCRADKTEILSATFLNKKPTGQFPKESPRTGELWLVKQELGGWAEKSRYYNGPVVLIMDDSDQKTVNVLQIYDDDYFKGPDDVSLGDGLAGFAEPWNRYSLSRDDLAVRLGKVTRDVEEKCRGYSSVPSIEIEQGSLLWFFRNMEVETGFYFARRSIANVLHDNQTGMGQTKTSGLNSIFTEQLLLQLPQHRLQCKESLPKDAGVLDILASCCLSDDRLPLAAADTNKSALALVFIFEMGRLESYTTCTFELHQTEIQGNSLLVSGTLPDKAVDFDEFYCWWEREGKMLPPDQGSSGYDHRVFWATFSQAEPIKRQEKYEIIIRCIKYI
jgi:hypothetical protein